MESVLRVRIDGASASRDARDLDNNLNRLDRRGNAVTRTFSGLKGVLATIGFGALVTDMVRSITQFDSYERTLQTFTGSAELAGDALDAIIEFSDTVPFSLEQSINAFTQMRALGLDPTTEALTSFANTGAAMGKTLEEVVAAVADAGTFQFERLREAFGVTTQTLDSTVKFTFQGVTTEVEKSSEAITAFLQTIGDSAFAGAAERKMDGLEGQFSNLRTQTQLLWKALGDSGVESAIGDILTGVSGFIATLSDNVDEAADFVRGLFDALEDVATSDAVQVFVNNAKPLLDGFISQIRDILILLQTLSRDRSLKEQFANQLTELVEERDRLQEILNAEGGLFNFKRFFEGLNVNEIQDKIDGLNTEIAETTELFDRAVEVSNLLAGKFGDVSDKGEEAAKTLNEIVEATKADVEAKKVSVDFTEELTDEIERLTEAMLEQHNAFRDLEDRLKPVDRLTRDFVDDVKTLNDQFSDKSSDEYRKLLELLTKEFEGNLKDAIEESTDCLSEFEKALKAIDEITLENIGDAFGTFFSGLTLDFDRLFDDLVLVAQQRSKDLFAAAFQDIQAGGGLFGGGLTAQNAAGLFAGAAPSLVGGAFGNQSAGIGSQLGGLLGPAAFETLAPNLFSSLGAFGGPVGTIIGSIVGGILGDIFDDTNPPRVEVVNTLSNADPSGIRSQSPFTDQFGNPIFVAGRQVTEEFGRGQTQQALDALTTIDRLVFDLLDEGQRRSVGNALVPGGNQETSQLFSGDFTIEEIAFARFDQILQGIGGTVESLVRGTGFKDVDEGIAALASVQNIFKLLNTDVQELRDSIINGPTSLVEAFEFQKEGVIGLIEAFDGSLASLQAVEGGLQGLATSAAQAFALIEQTSQQISQRSDQTVFGLQFGALGSPEEQFAFLDAEIERLVNLLPSLTDPGQINSTLSRIEQLTTQANGVARGFFTDENGVFDQAGFKEFTDNQVQFLQDQQQIAQDLLTGISDTIADSLTDALSNGADTLTAAAVPYVEAGGTFLDAARIFQAGVQQDAQNRQNPIVLPSSNSSVGAEEIGG